MLAVNIDNGKIRIGDRFTVSFQRTLRIPDDGHKYPLPPGLGVFPVLKVADYIKRVPPQGAAHPGVFIPMYQREALWLGFSAASWKPNAVKVAVGSVNAISGAADDNVLRDDPQDYMVCPIQPWLDGIHTGPEAIRQFVAMPLGQGYTIEASLTGAENVGGIQITVFEPKPGKFPDTAPQNTEAIPRPRASLGMAAAQTMGIGAGGTMRQKIYPDPYGVDAWDPLSYGRIFVHIVNSAQFAEITGTPPPATPIDARIYTEYGLPWFDLYDEGAADIPSAEALAEAKTISQREAEVKGHVSAEDSFDVSESQVKKLHHDDSESGKR